MAGMDVKKPQSKPRLFQVMRTVTMRISCKQA
jgi:hypothetical protein